MDRQRLISDARRRAKALARADGRPYQTHLDETACQAGRADWNAFVRDPSSLPPTPAAPRSVDPQEHAIAAKRDVVPHTRGIARMAAMLTAMTIPMMATAAIAIDASRMSDVSERVAAESAHLAHVRPPLQGFAGGGTRPATLGPMRSGHREVAIIMNDMRVAGSSRILRYMPGHEPYVFIGDDLGGRRMKEELADGSLMRIVLDVDCRTSTLRYLRFEAVRDMESEPSFTHPIAIAGHAFPIGSVGAERDLCETATTRATHVD